MEKRPLIVFSGGIDSTYLLHEALKKGEASTVYICGSQGAEKIAKEKVARRKIISKLEEIHPHRVVSDYVLELDFKFSSFGSEYSYGYSNPHWKFKQLHTWLYGMMEVVNPQRHSEVQMGYICDDQITTHLHQIESIWNNLQEICFRTEIVPIKFPLKYVEKQEILRDLPDDVKALTWSCEMPRGEEECGRCHACISLNAAKYTAEYVKSLGQI